MLCSRCSVDKPETDFYRPKREKVCKPCHKQRWKEWKARTGYKYNHNKENAKESRKKWRSTREWNKRYFLRVQNGARSRAKEAGLPFSLKQKDLEDQWAAQDGRCALSGVVFQEGSTKFLSPSLDRITPVLGYVAGNVRFITFSLNTMKGEASDEDLFSLCRMVVERNL